MIILIMGPPRDDFWVPPGAIKNICLKYFEPPLLSPFPAARSPLAPKGGVQRIQNNLKTRRCIIMYQGNTK